MSPRTKSEWIPLEEAVRRVLAAVVPGPSETVDYTEAGGRWLAQPVAADRDQPPFDRSMMDGYAVRSADLSSQDPLVCVGEVAAGAVSDETLGEGTCLQIYTGARIPPGADAVVPVEQTTPLPDGRVRFESGVTPGAHIGRAGSHLKKGDVLLEAGERIGPAQIAVLAMTGTVRVDVGPMPRVRVLATGDELVDPAEDPGPAGIRESNAAMLRSFLQGEGFSCGIGGRVVDEADAVRAAIEEAVAEADFVVMSGGVSMGERDFVQVMLEEMGGRLLFDQVRIKPGKPLTVADLGGTLAFGLPGNPVSAFVTAHQVLLPALRRFAGDPAPLSASLPARLAASITAKGPRPELRPVLCIPGPEGLLVHPVSYHGSADLAGLARGNALALLPAEAGELPEGTLVTVRPYDPAWLGGTGR